MTVGRWELIVAGLHLLLPIGSPKWIESGFSVVSFLGYTKTGDWLKVGD